MGHAGLILGLGGSLHPAGCGNIASSPKGNNAASNGQFQPTQPDSSKCQIDHKAQMGFIMNRDINVLILGLGGSLHPAGGGNIASSPK